MKRHSLHHSRMILLFLHYNHKPNTGWYIFTQAQTHVAFIDVLGRTIKFTSEQAISHHQLAKFSSKQIKIYVFPEPAKNIPGNTPMGVFHASADLKSIHASLLGWPSPPPLEYVHPPSGSPRRDRRPGVMATNQKKLEREKEREPRSEGWRIFALEMWWFPNSGPFFLPIFKGENVSFSELHQGAAGLILLINSLPTSIPAMVACWAAWPWGSAKTVHKG